MRLVCLLELPLRPLDTIEIAHKPLSPHKKESLRGSFATPPFYKLCYCFLCIFLPCAVLGSSYSVYIWVFCLFLLKFRLLLYLVWLFYSHVCKCRWALPHMVFRGQLLEVSSIIPSCCCFVLF